MNKFYLNLILIHFVSAAVYIKAPCPDVKAVENFDMDAYMKGKWYQIGRYPNDIDKKGDCVSTVVTKNKDHYLFTINEVTDGKINTLKYNSVQSTDKSGLIIAHSADEEVDEVNHTFPFLFVTVDYNNYAIGYDCRYNEETKTRHEYAWIQSRSKKLEGSSRDAVFDFIKSSGYLDINLFAWDHFTEETCKINS